VPGRNRDKGRAADPLIEMIRRAGTAYRRFGKRAFDLAVAVPAVIVLFPVMLALSLLVRAVLGSPVLFRQARPGLHGKPFAMYKFRTMTEEGDSRGNPLPDGERLQRCGRFLRSASLDELPTFINVIKGDMSLVGPRALLVRYLDRYTPEQMRRHEVRPGITGWAQVNGRNALSWERKFEMDVWYVDNLSFGIDVRILLVTIWRILMREGISQSGHATMPEFMGSGTSRSEGDRG